MLRLPKLQIAVNCIWILLLDVQSVSTPSILESIERRTKMTCIKVDLQSNLRSQRHN